MQGTHGLRAEITGAYFTREKEIADFFGEAYNLTQKILQHNRQISDASVYCSWEEISTVIKVFGSLKSFQGTPVVA